MIQKLKPFVDWIGLSIDSADEKVEVALGRGNGGHVKKILELAKVIHKAGIKLKINTTVTRLNWQEDIRPLIRLLKPDRWKVFQVPHFQARMTIVSMSFQFPLLGIFRCTIRNLGKGGWTKYDFQFPLLGIFRCTCRWVIMQLWCNI
jgi:MoaA/NifB/PqqE/SkfB family radical SAM enzyme